MDELINEIAESRTLEDIFKAGQKMITYFEDINYSEIQKTYQYILNQFFSSYIEAYACDTCPEHIEHIIRMEYEKRCIMIETDGDIDDDEIGCIEDNVRYKIISEFIHKDFNYIVNSIFTDLTYPDEINNKHLNLFNKIIETIIRLNINKDFYFILNELGHFNILDGVSLKLLEMLYEFNCLCLRNSLVNVSVYDYANEHINIIQRCING